jgi:hypothetical protein
MPHCRKKYPGIHKKRISLTTVAGRFAMDAATLRIKNNDHRVAFLASPGGAKTSSMDRSCSGQIVTRGNHDAIHQFHGHQHPDAPMEPSTGQRRDLASGQGHHAETHDHRPACTRTGLAAL